MADKKPKFLRRNWIRHSKLGKGRKKKQTWRKPTGRDNKMREKRGGYPATVSIGYRTDRESRGKIEGKSTKTVSNIAELGKMKKGEIAFLKSVGKKKKTEIAKKAKEMGIEIHNLNIDKFLKSKKEKVK